MSRTNFLVSIIIIYLSFGCGTSNAKITPAPYQSTKQDLQTIEHKSRDNSFVKVTHYGGKPASVKLTNKEKKVLDIISSSFVDKTGKISKTCKLDAPLVLAARKHAEDLANSNGVHGAAGIDYLRFALLEAGSIDYMIEPTVFVAGALFDDKIQNANFTKFVKTNSHKWTHCGIGVANNNSENQIVFIGATKIIEIDPVSVLLKAGDTITLSGRLVNKSSKNILVYLGLPNGKVVKPVISKFGKSYFSAKIFFEKAGRYDLELVIDIGQGPETGALLPIYVDIPVQTRPVVILQTTDTSQSSKQTLANLINTARKRVSVMPLKRDPKLDKIAQAHCLDMVSLDYFGHRSPKTGLLSDRLSALGMCPVEISENVARSSNVFRIHKNLIGSPSHKIKILNPDFTHMGLGISKNGNNIVVTEIFARW